MPAILHQAGTRRTLVLGRQQNQAARPRNLLNIHRPLVVRASAEVAQSAKTQKTGFLDDLRTASMKLHTREQAPKEGGVETPKKQQAWVPSRAGYLKFLVESKVVFDTFERIFKQHSSYAPLASTGLERGDALTQDIQWFHDKMGLQAPAPGEDGPGMAYAKLLEELAVSNPPAFMCHYYNHYFAHTAGGRMIGAQVGKLLLDGQVLKFYQWDGDVKALLEGARAKIGALADSWTAEERQRCIDETANTFKYAGGLMRCMTEQ